MRQQVTFECVDRCAVYVDHLSRVILKLANAGFANMIGFLQWRATLKATIYMSRMPNLIEVFRKDTLEAEKGLEDRD